MKKQVFVKIVCVMMLAGSGFALSNGNPDREAAKAIVFAFSRAIENADINAFQALLAEDCKMFFPYEARRANNRTEIVANVAAKFAHVRKSIPEGKVVELQPVDIDVSLLGAEYAVVTWQLDRPVSFGRRTAVLQKKNGKWLMKSFHSSNFTLSKEAQAN